MQIDKKLIIEKIKAFYFKYEWQVLLIGTIIIVLIIFFKINDTDGNEDNIDSYGIDKNGFKEIIKRKEDSIANVYKPQIDLLNTKIENKDIEIRILREEREVYYINWRVAEGKIKKLTVHQMQKKFDSLYPKMK